MDSFQHAANSADIRTKALVANGAAGERYQMCSLYYAGGYFSLRQAIEIDAIRAAIDKAAVGRERLWMLCAWLAAAATVINAPGHTAQFLKPNDAEMMARMVRTWRRSVWSIFQDRLLDVRPISSRQWRRKNQVYSVEALALLEAPLLPQDTAVIYADPPYTRDQYSRYYHVYEALFRYDYPEIHGAGRSPLLGFKSAFSTKSLVLDSFRRLFRGVRQLGLPLILSYPSNGLLHARGVGVEELMDGQFRVSKHLSIPAAHSTMGASKGTRTKNAVENLYVCIPT
jgi:adenine-specific DNA-methyltransferase